MTRNWLAGYHARDPFAPCDALAVDGKVGALEGIGSVNVQITISEEILVVPNTRLTEGTVRVRKTAPSEQKDPNTNLQEPFHSGSEVEG
jgi:hypothetical protein